MLSTESMQNNNDHKNNMEVWTASHITNLNRLNTLRLAITSAQQTLSSLTDSFTHRISISYNALMSATILDFLSTSEYISCVFYDQGITKITQFEHIQYIQKKAEEANINTETMIVFLDDDDLLLSYPLIWDSYDVVVGWQEVPVKYAMPRMRLFAELEGYIGLGLEFMLGIQENAHGSVIKNMIEEKFMMVETVSDFSGYSARFRVVNEVFEQVKGKDRYGLQANMVDLDIMNALDTYENKLSDEERPFVYHRLMSSKDWINFDD